MQAYPMDIAPSLQAILEGSVGGSVSWEPIFWGLDIASSLLIKGLFRCLCIRLNPCVLFGWIGVEFKLNFTIIHDNTHGLESIHRHPK